MSTKIETSDTSSLEPSPKKSSPDDFMDLDTFYNTPLPEFQGTPKKSSPKKKTPNLNDILMQNFEEEESLSPIKEKKTKPKKTKKKRSSSQNPKSKEKIPIKYIQPQPIKQY